MTQLIKMAFRELLRNKRRSFFSSLALGIGLALLLLMASVISGEMRYSMESAVKLQSGHLQVQAKTYNEAKNSLAYEDMIAEPDLVAEKIAGLAPVKVATPRLIASAIISNDDETNGVRLFGVDPVSPASDPFKQEILSGDWIKPDDRSGIMIGQALAQKMNLKSGDSVNLMANTSNGDVDQQMFTIRGIFTTRTPAFDDYTVILPIAKAQALTKTEGHASLIYVLLNDPGQVDAVRAALTTESLQIKTYLEMNDMILQMEEFSRSYMILIYLIVLAITATVIVNTLVMSVFERTREIGILSAIGMKSSRIMSMFFIESGFLAVGGIIAGLIMGGLMVYYASTVGFYFGDVGSTGLLIGERIYAYMQINDAVTLTILAFAVAILAALYPAIMAARLEPVEAMRGGKN
ncbi:MAG: ABC transporter permease [Chloroflexi bacterium]|nr:ABC transporter permease [Chloroflexota bacterium]BCY18448.1 ABC transporter permease [Leptolinea sp. HRD-7]